MKNMILVFSLLINVALAYRLLSANDLPEHLLPGTTPKSQSINNKHSIMENSSTTSDKNPNETASPQKMFTHKNLLNILRERAVPEPIIRQLLLSSVNNDYKSASPTQPSLYWKNSAKSESEKIRAQLEADAEKRKVILALFGDSAKEDPAFAELFQPFKDTLNFISSDKQVALYELASTNKIKNTIAAEEMLPNDAVSTISKNEAELQFRLETLLSPEEIFEYRVRISPEAQKMREAFDGLDIDEIEFRELFAINEELRTNFEMLRNDPESSDAWQQFMSAREATEEKVRTYLGDDRYKKYQRNKDPAFKKLITVSQKNGIDRSSLETAYDISQVTADKIKQLNQNLSLDKQKRNNQISNLMEKSYNTMKQLVGEEVSSYMLPNPPPTR